MDRQKKQRLEGFLFLAAFCATIPLANWLIGNVGTECVPDGPCIIPIWPGIVAPSGVLAVGAALVLRDMVQRRLGIGWALAAIGVGAVLSGFVAPAAWVIASVAAFIVSETADMAVFTPLQKRGLVLAVFASSVIGLAVDSMIFLSLAFGGLDFLAGQMIGKSWAILIALPLVHMLRNRDRRLGFAPA